MADFMLEHHPSRCYRAIPGRIDLSRAPNSDADTRLEF
jgi:hypothetical protein